MIYIYRKLNNTNFVFIVLLMILGLHFTSYADITPVSDRTTQVRDAIVAEAGVNSASEVTDTQLSAITSLNLRAKNITELKSGDFSGMTGLTSLNLYGNQLSSLPDGIFDGLTALTTLRLGGNTVDPMPITVKLEKVEESQFKVVVPTGAPFQITLSVNVTNGNIIGETTTLTVSKGTDTSDTFTVSRATDVKTAVTVNIGTISNLPINHYGYVLSTASSPVEVIMENVAPVFTDGTDTTREIVENTEAGVNIGTPVAATDFDGDPLAYTLNGTDAAAFDIDRQTGQLKTKEALNYEAKSTYQLTITVSDGTDTNSIAVTINIIDDIINSPAPTFNDGVMTVRTIAENSNMDTPIGKPILATTYNEHGLTYSLGGSNADVFDIDAETAQLRTRAPLDYEKQNLYMVTVNATDGTNTSSITVIINVTDLADTIDLPIMVPVVEQTPQVPDAADITPISDRTTQVRDAIVAEAGVNSASEVTNTHLAAIKSLNLRAKNIIELKSGDFSGMTGLTSLNLYGNQLSSLPDGIFAGLTALTTLRLGGNTVDPMPIAVKLEKVEESQFKVVVPTGAPFQIMLAVNVTNGNIIGGTTILTVSKGTDTSDTYTVSRTTGVKAAVTVDIGTSSNLPINHYGYVLSTSSSPVEVIMANVAPMFTDGTDTTREIVENTEAGVNIGTPIAATDFEDDPLTYTLNGTDAAVFDIDRQTGQLKTKEALNYEAKSTYQLTITASDGTDTNSIAVTINIIDDIINSPAPTFNDGVIAVRTIAENSDTDTPIGKPILATTHNEHGLTYSLGGYHADVFDIHAETAQLRTQTPLDYEKQNLYVVVVNATDGTNTNSITVIISVTDLADAIDVPTTVAVVDRTPQVRDAIVDVVLDVDTAEQITATHLAQITRLNLRNTGIDSLKRGDFGGMTALENLNLYQNNLPELPVGIFEGLTALTSLRLGNNPLRPMPVFVSMQKIDENAYIVIVPSGAPFDITVPLIVQNGSLIEDIISVTVPRGSVSSLAFTLVSNMTTETHPTVEIGDLPMLPQNHYGYVLTKSTACNRTPQVRDAIIERITTITTCRHVSDVDLATIAALNLDDQGIETLIPLDFSGMLSLTTLSLKNNKITSLPDGIFAGLYSLKALDLTGNGMTDETMLPLSIAVEIVKVNGTGIKAVVPTGAPFDIELPLTIPNGMLPDEVTTLVVRTGDVESDVFTVSRIPNTIDAVTIDYDLPSMLPTLHAGYVLDKINKEPIQMIDRIEVAPVFSDGEAASRTITENSEPGVNIGDPIMATDANDDKLTYTLAGDDLEAFVIDTDTGQLTTKEPLDYESKDTYSVVVRVTDSIWTEMTSVTISVENANDPPAFVDGEKTDRTIGELAATETNIGNPIAASDQDNDTLTYSLGGDDADVFSIDDTNGQLKTKEPLDYETTAAYAVEVNVSDPSGESDSIVVTIDITDENEPPAFVEGSSTTRSIAENTAKGLNIGDPVSATDPDANQTLTYTLTGKEAETFSIDRDTGQLKTRGPLDFETKNKYVVTITVSDNELDATIEVDIQIIDVEEIVRTEPDTTEPDTDTEPTPTNTAPTFTEGSSTTRFVDENTASGENIGSAVDATDADNDTLSYSLSGTDAASFTIVNTSGQLQTSAELNYDIQNTYSVVVSVSDGNGGSDSITVTINITEVTEVQVNNAPAFTEGGSTIRTIAENTASGVNIGSPVAATDADNDTLAYALGGTDAASFTILSTNGQLQTSAALDFDIQNTYSVVVSVSDGNGGSDTITVTINITEVLAVQGNNAPEFTAGTSTTRTIAENTASGVNIGSPVAATDDNNDTLSYALGGTDAASFTIVSTSGQLQTSAELDFETDNSYSVVVSVSDGKGGSDTITVTINITDANDAPEFTAGTSTTRSISENAASGINIGGPIFATDDDNDTLAYTLGGTDAASFTIVNTSGQLQTSAALDFDIQNSYSVVVSVSDGNGGSDSINVTINITEVNNAPEFTEGESTTRDIAENTASGVNIGSPVTATDADNDTLSYSLGGTDAASFTIVSTTGQLQTSAALDFDTQNSYSVVVSVSDPNGGSDTINVTINITNVNEYAPTFTEGDSTIRFVVENTTSGVNIGDPVSATDDDNDTLSYTLGGTDAASFTIVSTSGQLQTSAALDYETDNSYSVIVTVSDPSGGSDTITVTINIIDINEHQPMFPGGDSITRFAAENTPSGVNIGDPVSATDADNDTLTYTLGGTDAASFSIVSRHGQLQTSAALDYDTKNSYSVVVSVSDGRGGSDSITVTINIIEITPTAGNNAPEFTAGNSIAFFIPEHTASGVNFPIPVSATDDDNDTLTYTLGGTNAGSFTIVSTNGQLKTSAPLDYETKNSYTVVVYVSDRKGGSDSINVFINVTDELDSKPLSERTGVVRQAILDAIDGVTDADDVTDAHLAAITSLSIFSLSITRLNDCDFEGLSGITTIRIRNSRSLSILPEDLFDGLSTLTTLAIIGNSSLSSLPEGLFDGLSALTTLHILNNSLTALPADLFDGLTSLEELEMSRNSLTSLPSDIFAGLSSLKEINMHSNSLTSLPDKLFEGLSSLTSVNAHSNSNILPLNVSLVKVADGEFKAAVHTGAPARITCTLTVTNGTIDGGTSIIRIQRGQLESNNTLTVTRTPGTTAAVTVAIESLSNLSSDSYDGLTLVSPDTALEVIPATGGAPLGLHNVPDRSALLPNYPNPFNPETWIPYQLAKPADVTMTIYNMRGVVVRQLALGHRPAGSYRSRARAAYWNGRNALGEKAATGVYFVTFTAGNYTATRKMLIRK